MPVRNYLLFFLLLFTAAVLTAQTTNRPNILWISCEDLSPHFSFYGDSTVATPHLDRLAREGVVYDNVFTTAGVCAPSRCAIITGVNQVTAGGHNMRTLTNTFPEKTGLPTSYSIVPPIPIKAFPEYLRAQGYYCTNNVKTDYQFEAPPTVWDEVSSTANWRNRVPGQPFFAVMNIMLTHESQVWQRSNLPLHADPWKIKVPPYYPDTRTVRKDMARFYSNIVDMDSVVGNILHQLEADGLLDQTIIFFWGDHGDGLPFCKRELYDRGLKIPLVIRFPGKQQAGERDSRLISAIDFSATVLSLAGIAPPTYMQGTPFLGKYQVKQEHSYIYAARDRMDSEYDRVRAVRDKRYKYIKNFRPELPPYQNIEFRLQMDMMKEILALKEKGQLDSIQMKWFARNKPAEELYDLQNDPLELHNVATNPQYGGPLQRMRQAMNNWIIQAKDLGAVPEKELVKKMWQGKDARPVTADVMMQVTKNIVSLSCATPGASIGYKIDDTSSAWKVYVKPFVIKPGQQVFTMAQRIGYQKSERKAYWISRYNNNDSVQPAPLFRKSFQVKDVPTHATIDISGLGFYELFINGKKIGDRLFDPAFTRYDKRVLYTSYEVTKNLQPGNNVITVLLGNGWYNPHTKTAWDFDKAPWRNAPALWAQLAITYSNGLKQFIYTDSTWQSATGPLIFDGIQNGETYDARLEYNHWQPAVQVKGPAGRFYPQSMPPEKVIETIAAKKIMQPQPGVWLVDFGVNLSGRVRIHTKAKAGEGITIRYGEKLHPDGTLDQKELARFIRTGDTQTDRYIAKGTGEENWSPRFVYHGFRYVQITGLPGALTANNIVAESIHTDLATTGQFACSNELLNALHKAARQSLLSNFHGYPTDCPHREKMGWTGDAQLTCEMALFNFDMTQAYGKWLDDFTDEQQPNGQLPGIIPTSGWGYTYGNDSQTKDRGYGPQWEGAYLTIPWQLYVYTGDSNIIKKYYPGLKRYIDYLANNSHNYILNFGIDDHKFFKTPTDPPVIATAYYYYLTSLLSKMAGVTGQTNDIDHYHTLAEKIKQAYNSTFKNSSQTGWALALYHGLTNSTNKTATLDSLLTSLRNNDWHFDAGVLGVKAITNVLINDNLCEELYSILSSDTYPSFGYWIKQGATTLWQDWAGERSLNHIMFGSFTEFFYKALVGINPDPQQPGFKHILLTPHFIKDLQWVKGSYRSRYGVIASEWKRAGNKIIYQCTVPPHTTALLTLPNKSIAIHTGTHRFEF